MPSISNDINAIKPIAAIPDVLSNLVLSSSCKKANMINTDNEPANRENRCISVDSVHLKLFRNLM